MLWLAKSFLHADKVTRMVEDLKLIKFSKIQWSGFQFSNDMMFFQSHGS